MARRITKTEREREPRNCAFNLSRIYHVDWEKFDSYLFEKFDTFRQLLLLGCHMGASRRFCQVHTDVHDVTQCNVSTAHDISTY